jgi:mannose-6-phosphate isomerase-like protein (cupin superfamily)
MRLGDADESEIVAGDCVVIPPGTPHKLWNTGSEPLVLLCCCAPAYSHDDTVMTGG